ncbi:imidazole glycerol phosphate synthase subunit HisH [Shinella sp. H4-D48]|uniref:imidazole glycerol phosphate synthase subunit HisH n=1 Tax=Shinella sp. H4-D48 TaxID=2925841 RepID=UPI001F5339D8|nr:imidazole glycerol phosphate synthase subunit HisH [Shinella sp. H4-D48]UNK38223.1 imidazole glycerol phosphate synthase subunit HisH [Shinella sp. H4-D48]
MNIGIIDYGVGNIGSIERALEELAVTGKLLTDPSQIMGVEKIVLPGVGSYTECMMRLHAGGWVDALQESVTEKRIPLLGVCVGMQLLSDFGAEGAADEKGTPGLGFVPGTVLRMPASEQKLRLPHVGWNEVYHRSSGDTLFSGIPNGSDFYFVHSYAFIAENQDHVAAVSFYGTEFVAAVHNRNVWGTQFHPEKSSRAGFAVLKNFASI